MSMLHDGRTFRSKSTKVSPLIILVIQISDSQPTGVPVPHVQLPRGTYRGRWLSNSRLSNFKKYALQCDLKTKYTYILSQM